MWKANIPDTRRGHGTAQPHRGARDTPGAGGTEGCPGGAHRPHPEIHPATASWRARPSRVSAPASRDTRVPAPLRRADGDTFPACDIWSPADTSESEKPPISGQNPVPSWGTGVGVARKRSLRYVPFLFLARFPKEMRCLQSRPLSCLSLMNTSFECIAQFQPNLTAREKLQREFFSCRFCGRKYSNLIEKSAFALWKAGTGRQGPRAVPTAVQSPAEQQDPALLPPSRSPPRHLYLPQLSPHRRAGV